MADQEYDRIGRLTLKIIRIILSIIILPIVYIVILVAWIQIAIRKIAVFTYKFTTGVMRNENLKPINDELNFAIMCGPHWMKRAWSIYWKDSENLNKGEDYEISSYVEFLFGVLYILFFIFGLSYLEILKDIIDAESNITSEHIAVRIFTVIIFSIFLLWFSHKIKERLKKKTLIT